MNHNIGETRRDRIFNYFNYFFLALITLTILYPLIFIVSASFSSTEAVSAGKVWLWPVDFSLKGYETIFNYHLIWTGYANSLFYTTVGTLINITLTILAAYPLSRSDFKGRNVFMFILFFTMLFNGGLIPTYLLVKDLGMLNTRWALMIPNAMSVFNVIIARTYFRTTIPKELLESAQLDGCSDFRFLKSIVLPLSGPIIAVITLFYAVGHWNSYFDALIYLRDQSLYPLQLVLQNILIQSQIGSDMIGSVDIETQQELIGLEQLLKYSLIVVASVPVLIMYPFVQKHFVKGVMIGALKE